MRRGEDERAEEFEFEAAAAVEGAERLDSAAAGAAEGADRPQ